ncbi:MAG TPA: tail fiber domain-containing protein, partial [Terriglobia bacterium]|nr:tail fiber domain-containing protein [Terriglobia bacterium]
IKENSIQGNYATAMVFDTRANGGNQTEQMRINSAGNLGIGTSNPAHKLDVAGDINALTSGTSTAIVGTNTGTANDGVDGIASNVAGTGAGVYGESDSNAGYGVFGYAGAASGTTYGVYGQSLSSNGIGVYGQGGQWAGYFAGNVNATGTVTAPAFNGTATNAVALGGLPASGYAPATGSTSYIANGITPQTASLNITGSGTFGGAVTGGAGTFNGVVSAAGALLPATGAATTSAGFNSNALDLIASVYNSGTPAAQNETFQWQAEPVASSNNTASPSATMNLLFGANNSTPAETGLSIASNGVIAFAPSQNFGSSSTVITGSTATFTGGTTSGGVLSATQSGTGAAAVLTNSSTGDILDASNGSGSVYKITNSGGITSAGLVIQPSVTETNGTTNCTSGTPCTSANMLGGYLGTAGVANQIGLGVTGATIAGGGGNFGKNYVLTDWGTIAGGYGNHMTDGCIAPDCLGNTISGGANNTEGLGGYLTIAGGFHNSASGTGDTAGGYATVGGGWYNGAGKSYATVPGGKANLADGRYSFAAGCQAKANDDGAFVWSGYNGTACTTVSSSNTIAGQFIALAPGGFTFYPDVVSAAPAHPVTITTGGSMSLPGNLTVTGTITGANVGIGTSTPAAELNLANGSGTSYSDTLLLGNSTTKGLELADNGGGGLDIKTFGEALFINYGTGQNTYINGSSGNVGIGTISPDATLSVNGTADKPSGGSWATFSDERLKTIDGSFALGLAQVLRLNPVVYRYKNQNAMGISDHQPHVGLVAQEVQKAIPEAVSTNNKGYLLVNNDPIIWAMLNAIKEQQAEIAKLQRASAAKNAQMVAMKLQIDELRKAQQQMAVVVARLAQQQVGHIHVANSGSASHSRPKLKRSARTEVARVRF